MRENEEATQTAFGCSQMVLDLFEKKDKKWGGNSKRCSDALKWPWIFF
jgi:hypothetical protein